MTTSTASPVAFALQELTACWNQGYEALVRGDLERVQSLLELADDRSLTIRKRGVVIMSTGPPGEQWAA